VHTSPGISCPLSRTRTGKYGPKPSLAFAIALYPSFGGDLSLKHPKVIRKIKIPEIINIAFV
jgi:hypothetical protein